MLNAAFAITEVWTEISFEGTRQHRQPEGETLQVRRVPKGKLKLFITAVYYRLENIYFICSIVLKGIWTRISFEVTRRCGSPTGEALPVRRLLKGWI